jgi:hypothetical protein
MNKDLLRIVAVIIAILLLRIGLVNIYEHFGVRGGMELFSAIGIIIYDPLNVAITLSSTLLLGWLINRVEWLRNNTLLRGVSWIVVVAGCALLATVIAARSESIVAWGAEWCSILFSALILCSIALVTLYLSL